VLKDESMQCEVKFLQSPDKLHVPRGQEECILRLREESILRLMLAITTDKKHRKELHTILNETSQGHLEEYLSGYDCKLIFELACNHLSFNYITVMLLYLKGNFEFESNFIYSISFTMECIPL